MSIVLYLSCMNLSKNTLGYTLFELIIVVTIIVILGTV